jgi:DNA-binding NarL/FixJ family response regulator
MQQTTPTRSTLDPRRILVVDDHPMTRLGLRELIQEEADLAICGEADTAARALEAANSLNPDLILVDITLPQKSGLSLIKELRAWRPESRILALSMHDECLYAERVLRSGGDGYVSKNAGGEKVLEAIRQVLDGRTYVSDQVSGRIVDVFAGRRSGVGDATLGRLTEREFEVFELVGQGLPTAEIGQRLHLSPKTVDTHRLHIKEKLQLGSLPELMRYAVRWSATEEVI